MSKVNPVADVLKGPKVKIGGETITAKPVDLTAPGYGKVMEELAIPKNYWMVPKIEGKQFFSVMYSTVEILLDSTCDLTIDHSPVAGILRPAHGIIVLVNGSTLGAGELNHCSGVSFVIDDTMVDSKERLGICSAVITRSIISADTIDLVGDSELHDACIHAGSIRTNKSELRKVTLTGFSSVKLYRCRTGDEGGEFILSADDNSNQTILVDEVSLPNHCQELPEDVDLDILIQHRIDVGSFAGVRDVPFIRSKRADLVVGEYIFTEEELWPEEGEEDVGSVYVQTFPKDNPLVIKTRAMLNELKYWSCGPTIPQPLRRATDTEHMLVKSILVGIVSRVNLFKTLDALR